MNRSEQSLELLTRYWGYSSFRPLQEEAINAVLDGAHSLLVLPTGGGKSLCFQLPALMREGLAVVVSPLISLMKDQVDSLNSDGVPAAFFNSSMQPDEQAEVRRGLRAGDFKLLYVAPERLAGDGSGPFLDLLADVGVSFFAIDEAHCISQWGHNFRPEYRQLRRLKERFPKASFHAFTATATDRVRADIVDQLGLPDAKVLVGSFDRPNLMYRVRRRSDANAQLKQLLARHPDEGGIIYCQSRKRVESLAKRLNDWGVSALPYHAGLSDLNRSKNQEAFLNEEVDVVVATVAFGMGIDRSNVRFVAHVGAPRSVEHYQQEAGRAGRDGLPSECLLLYSPGDFVQWRRLLEMEGTLDESAVGLLRDMQRYAGSMRCRHRMLVEYFGQSYVGHLEEADSQPETPGACRTGCDWCLGELETVEGATVLAQKILSCVWRVEQRWGIAHVVSVLRGVETEKVLSNGHQNLSTFGLLNDLSVGELRGYIDQLLDQGALAQQGAPYPILGLTAAGSEILRGEQECQLVRQQQPKPQKKRRRDDDDPASWEGVDRDLFESLRDLRAEIAKERSVPPYVIFHDSMLRDMARLRPKTAEEFLEVYGVGEKKARDLGPSFLARIVSHDDSPARAEDGGSVSGDLSS